MALRFTWAVWENSWANSGTIQAQIEGFELVDPNIYSIQELLEQVKGPGLQKQSCRVSRTQDSERSAGESSVLIAQQKAKASNQFSDSLKRTSASRAVWAKK